MCKINLKISSATTDGVFETVTNALLTQSDEHLVVGKITLLDIVVLK